MLTHGFDGAPDWLRPHLHGMDPIYFLKGVYTGSDPELSAFTLDRIHLDLLTLGSALLNLFSYFNQIL